MDSSLDAWKKYLRNDPTRFLLDAHAPPSIHLWYALDLANRPEHARAVVELRERALYSDTVQAIFAAQKPEGYWENPESVVEPRYRATVWNLALLAELGIPRASRRARAGLEFVLEEDGQSRKELVRDTRALAHFLRAAIYFSFNLDPRVNAVAEDFASRTEQDLSFDNALMSLWAFGKWRPKSFNSERALDLVLTDLAQRAASSPLTFPQFDTDDDSFALRVLAEHGRANDPRAERALLRLVAKQDAHARWAVEKSLNEQLTAPLPDAADASYWITLNATRVIKAVIAA